MTDIDLTEARSRLTDLSFDERDVWLDGEPERELRMGSLRVLVAGDGVDVVAWDYGMNQVILRCRSMSEALDAVAERCERPLPPARHIGLEEYRSWVAETRESLAPLDEPLNRGLTVEVNLPPGSVVDRFGNLDGFLLYPAGLDMSQRSLPPNVLDPTRPELGLSTLGVAQPLPVLARRIAPAFGQPGGGVYFKIAQESDTVRDLVARGELVRLTTGSSSVGARG
jgi:hypothetical protein